MHIFVCTVKPVLGVASISAGVCLWRLIIHVSKKRSGFKATFAGQACSFIFFLGYLLGIGLTDLVISDK